jgi:hypothetical protein
MQEQYRGRLAPDMDVCDLDGDTIGKVAREYRGEFASVLAASATDTDESGDQHSRPGVMEVKSGLLGLGRLYIPISAVATEGCVFVAKKRDDRVDEWRRKPDYLDQLRWVVGAGRPGGRGPTLALISATAWSAWSTRPRGT